MKPKYTLRIGHGSSINPNSKAEAVVARKHANVKNQQLIEAVEWCKERGVRGQCAIKSRLFPMIKDRETINRRLDGKIVTGNERQYCSILTNEEENSIVRYVKNKNRSLQGINKSQLTKLILDTLKIRDHTNKCFKGGRRDQVLSSSAKLALKNRRLGRSFWLRFHAKHSSLTFKRQGQVSLNRALKCTKKMARSHLDALAEELISAGIMTNAEQIEEGIWNGNIDTSRIFNNDETPLLINYGVDGTSSGLVYAEKGDQCQKLCKENRECVTIHPFVSFSGEVSICQVIFGNVGITSHMVPAYTASKINHLLVTTSDHGVSDHITFLAALKEFDEYLTENNIQKPVVLLSDGHSSRFHDDVMSFLQSSNIQMFISPPDTTGVTHMLDQLNKNIHHEYRKEKDAMFIETNTLNKEAFMLILANIWDKWASKATLVKAAKRVGIAPDSLSVEFMQQDTFMRADSCIDQRPSTPYVLGSSTPGSSNADSSFIASPDKRKGSAMYWKKKFQSAQSLINELHEKSIQPKKIPGLMTIRKVKPKLTKDSTCVTQVHGSMKAKDVTSLVKGSEEQKNAAIKSKAETLEKKEQTKKDFMQCQEKCTCDKKPCRSYGLEQCPVCHNILKSICSKVSCRTDGKKPAMILLAASTQESAHKKSLFCDTDSDNDDTMLSYDEEEDVSESEDDVSDPVMAAKWKLKETWKTLNPPVKEGIL